MSNTIQPSYEINYISQQKKILVGRNNNTIYQKFKIDNRVQDTYYFQLVSKNNQIVDLSGFNYQFFGSYIDAKQYEHVLFFTDNFTITSGNILSFKVNTYTSEYVNYVKIPKQIDIAIRKKADGINQVILRDTGIAYPTPVYEGEQPGPTVAGFGLWKNGYVMSLTGTVLSGDNETIAINDNIISLIPTIPSAVSQLTNDAGYISGVEFTFENEGVLSNYQWSFAEDFRYYNGDIRLNYGVVTGRLTNRGFALTGQIPSVVSQLTNDAGFITGYNAGSGISIVDGTINCTVSGGGGGGATYTAGEGIGISDQNVISLTATIPTIPTNISYFTNDVGYITNAALTNYALKSQIPLSTSQLTNDSQYMSYSTFNMYGGNGISVYRDAENDDWIISWLYGDIIVGYGLSSTVDEYGYLHLSVNESALTGISIDNQQKMFIDNEVKTSSFVLGYNKDYDIFTNIIETNDGVLNINPLSGFEDIEVGKTATFEHWITPSGNLTGITFASGQTFIGQLPDSFTSGFTQVFTRRVISKNNNNNNIQQISYAYEFEDAQSPNS